MARDRSGDDRDNPAHATMDGPFVVAHRAP